MIKTDRSIVRVFRSDDKEEPFVKFEFVDGQTSEGDYTCVMDHENAKLLAVQIMHYLSPDFLDKYTRWKSGEEKEEVTEEMKQQVMDMLQELIAQWK